MAENQKTLKQQKTKYRALQYTTFVSEFISVFTPYIIMGLVNHDEWFPDAETSIKVTTGGALAMALLGIAVFLVGKNKEDKKVTSGYIALIVGWFATAFIFVMLASIMEQISVIMLYGGIGLCGAFGLHMFSKDYKEKADYYKSTLDEGKKELLKERAKAEIQRDEELKQQREKRKIRIIRKK